VRGRIPWILGNVNPIYYLAGPGLSFIKGGVWGVAAGRPSEGDERSARNIDNLARGQYNSLHNAQHLLNGSSVKPG